MARALRLECERLGEGIVPSGLSQKLTAQLSGWALEEFHSQQWLCYNDGEIHYAQPDIFALFRGPGQEKRLIVIECKLTETYSGDHQLRQLYGPLLHKLYGVPALLIQAFRNIRQRPDAFNLSHPFELLARPHPGVHYWHSIP